MLVVDLENNRISGNAKASDIKKLGLINASASHLVSANDDVMHMTDADASDLFKADDDDKDYPDVEDDEE